MEIPLFTLAFFLAGFSDVVTQRVTGNEGEDVTITCSHSNAFSNRKYFCKGACDDNDVLITSTGPNTDKYQINDRGNTFYVTISNLVKKDAGLYWCGIDRVGVDTYNSVYLTVVKTPKKKHPATTTRLTPTTTEHRAPKDPATTTRLTPTTPEHRVEDKSVTENQDGKTETTSSSSQTVVYIGTGLATCFVVLVLVFFVFLLHRRRNKGASSAGSHGKTDGLSLNSAPDQATVIYSDVTLNKDSQNPAAGTVYSNVTSTQPTCSKVPATEQVTYSAIRRAGNTSV